MPYELKELSGSLFKNDRREKDTHPQMQGTCLIDGVEYFISAWTKEGAKGRWQSLAFKRKDAKHSGGSTQPGKPNVQKHVPQDSDEIPF